MDPSVASAYLCSNFPPLFVFNSENYSFLKHGVKLYNQQRVQYHYIVVLQCQGAILYSFVHLPAEHICASVEMIECCLTGLTRKPHAGHHRGDASPAESEVLASKVYTCTHTQMYDRQACTYIAHTHAHFCFLSLN